MLFWVVRPLGKSVFVFVPFLSQSPGRYHLGTCSEVRRALSACLEAPVLVGGVPRGWMPTRWITGMRREGEIDQLNQGSLQAGSILGIGSLGWNPNGTGYLTLLPQHGRLSANLRYLGIHSQSILGIHHRWEPLSGSTCTTLTLHLDGSALHQ